MSATNPQPLTFIDTNIWLYAFNDSQDLAKTQRAKQIIRQIRQLVLSSQAVNEVCSNILWKFGADEGDVRTIILEGRTI